MATAKTPIEATAVGANPFLAVIVIVALARSFNEARYREEYGSLAKGVMKGGVGAGAFLGVASLVAGLTLPNWQAKVNLTGGFKNSSKDIRKTNDRREFFSQINITYPTPPIIKDTRNY